MQVRADMEHLYFVRMHERLTLVSAYLRDHTVPDATAPEESWLDFLAGMKALVGNASNDMSFVAAVLAKRFLRTILPMVDFDVGTKPQGAPGLDIDEVTTDGKRVIAEIKTTTPYGASDLGAQQRNMFLKDFAKLNAASAEHKFFFVTDRVTFELMRRKYASKIPNVSIVLLPSGDRID